MLRVMAHCFCFIGKILFCYEIGKSECALHILDRVKGTEMKAEFEVKVTQKTMFDFLMAHTYRSFSGWFGIAFGAAALALLIFTFGKVTSTTSAIYAFFAVYLLPAQPVMLYFRAAKQVKLNPGFRQPLLYRISDEGIHSAQGEQEMTLAWDQIVKASETARSFLLYTGKRYSFILPKECMGEQREIVASLIKTHLKPEQVKLK